MTRVPIFLLFLLGCLSAASGCAVHAATSVSATRPTTVPASARNAVVSPEIDHQGAVTFRFNAQKAKLVELVGDWPGTNKAKLTRRADGVWTATLRGIPSGLWAYSFKADGGADQTDPANPIYKPSRYVTSSVLDLSGAMPQWWDRHAGVPRGVIHLHDYDSITLGRARRLRVYTPPNYDPNYDPKSTEPFPVLYLLHGSGDNEMTWTDFGRANVIADNLIAAHSAKPMVIVMLDGHAVGNGEPQSRHANLEAFAGDLINDAMPLVESAYRVRADREGRALAGLSMGGNQAMVIGLRDTARFGWIAGMSSAIREPEQELPNFLSDPKSVGPTPYLLWMTIGTNDFLLKENRHFDALLTERHVPHQYTETAGGHAWPNWRGYLVDLMPKLFTDSNGGFHHDGSTN